MRVPFKPASYRRLCACSLRPMSGGALPLRTVGTYAA